MEKNFNYHYKRNTEILGLRDIDYMLEIINQETSDQVKAKELYEFCNEYYVEISFAHYSVRPESIEAKKMRKIKDAYSTYKINGYFNELKNPYRCTMNELLKRLDKLKKVALIIESDKSDYEKGSELFELYKNKTLLLKDFRLITKYGQNDERLLDARNELNNLNIIVVEFEKYINVYNKVHESKLTFEEENIINVFIREFGKLSDYMIFEKLGISKNKFKVTINRAKEYDKNLYQKYLDKIEEAEDREIDNNKVVISDLINGIRDSVLSDGTNFDILEFIKRVPFKDKVSPIGYLRKFTNKYDMCGKNELLQYIISNNITDAGITGILNIDYIYESKTIIAGRELTYEDKKLIVDYLIYREVPISLKSYAVAREMLLKGNLTQDSIENLKVKTKKVDNK